MLILSLITACRLGGDDDVPVTASAAPTSSVAAASSEEPGTLTMIAETNVDGIARVAASAGDFLYIVSSVDMQDDAHLRIFEVDADGSTTEMGSLDSGVPMMPASVGAMSRAAVAEGTLFVPLPSEDGSGGLWVVDVSDPAAPAEIALLETELPPLSVVVSGDVAAVAPMSFSGPVFLYDVADPENVQPIGELAQSLVQIPPMMAMVDSTLYVADESGVDVIDVSAPDTPEIVGTFENPDWSGPAVMDPSATEQPVIFGGVRNIFEGLGFSDFAVDDDHLYVVAGDGGVEIVDASDPADLNVAGHIDLDGNAMQVTAANDQLYILAGSREGEDGPISFGVEIVDISDVDSAEVTKSIELPGMMPTLGSLAVADDVFVIFGFDAVQVVDLS